MNPLLAERIKSDLTFPFQRETWERVGKPKQICLHHTASPPGLAGDINWWKNDNQPVSTPLIVGRDGIAIQIYSSTRWAFSLGLSHANYKQVEAATIGLEIDSWGYLTLKDGKFYSYTGAVVPASEVCVLDVPHKGQKYFHSYTPEQIETTRLLLLHWGVVYGIDLTYVGHDKMFGLCQDAIYCRKSGVYSHNSFRADKTDIHPQPDMIAMLQGLAV
jgi:N-acetylmuramoyl-L-alanine amidase